MAMQSASGLAGTIGSGITGFEGVGEQRQMDAAQVQLTLANAALVRIRTEDLRVKREQIKSQRAVVVSILRRDASAEHDPFLEDVALWVAAGGDPDYAFRYLIKHEQIRLAQEQRPTLILPPAARGTQHNVSSQIDAGPKAEPQ
ncbi:MAG TPA: hypothetical protein VMV15_12510 [Candidatus Binataceae bacterium]|nr:hypothetical protein [Candidatus Binataceae bacterium]